MERSDITNLNDIPFAPPSRSPIMPNGNVEGDNIRMNIDPQMMSKVVHDLEKPSAPAPPPQRDISRDPHMQSLVQDPSARPDSVPYSSSYPLPPKMIETTSSPVAQGGTIGVIWRNMDESRVYVMAALIYMLFQLPYVRDKLRSHGAFIYMDDGTPSTASMLAQSVIFGATLAAVMYGQVYLMEYLH